MELFSIRIRRTFQLVSTDNYRNKRLSGIKAAAQHVVRASGGSRPENGSTCSGQMNGRAGGMPGIGNLEEVSPGLP